MLRILYSGPGAIRRSCMEPALELQLHCCFVQRPWRLYAAETFRRPMIEILLCLFASPPCSLGSRTGRSNNRRRDLRYYKAVKFQGKPIGIMSLQDLYYRCGRCRLAVCCLVCLGDGRSGRAGLPPELYLYLTQVTCPATEKALAPQMQCLPNRNKHYRAWVVRHEWAAGIRIDGNVTARRLVLRCSRRRCSRCPWIVAVAAGNCIYR